MEIHCHSLLSEEEPSSDTGVLLFSPVPLSFWGGTDPSTGKVVDAHHDLCGISLRGAILAIPGSRGSCTGSTVILEMLLNATAPKALIFRDREEIVTAGVAVARELFGRELPVVVTDEKKDFDRLRGMEGKFVNVRNGFITARRNYAAVPMEFGSPNGFPGKRQFDSTGVNLNASDLAILERHRGGAAARAMKILVTFAKVQGATELIDVTQAHLDSVLYTGPAILMFAERLLALGDAKFIVPTTMNAISIDQQRWQSHSIDEEFAANANKLANAYVMMGARPTFTCAPYLLDSAPSSGEQVAWAESNAVVFANSVLGAKTQKYPDLIDVCIALVGRAPLAGCHTAAGRLPSIAINAPPPDSTTFDKDLFWSILGYCVGGLSGNRIPLVLGLEDSKPRISDLKAFGAAFATTSSASMFHVRGVTPEHCILRPEMLRQRLEITDLRQCFTRLNTAVEPSVSVIALGNPHFSFEEFEALAQLLHDSEGKMRIKHSKVRLMITTSRDIHQKTTSKGIAMILEDFGAEVITDTCWCMIQESTITHEDPLQDNIMTNSAKYAHYATGLVGRNVHFGSLKDCVEASMLGQRSMEPARFKRAYCAMNLQLSSVTNGGRTLRKRKNRDGAVGAPPPESRKRQKTSRKAPIAPPQNNSDDDREEEPETAQHDLNENLRIGHERASNAEHTSRDNVGTRQSEAAGNVVKPTVYRDTEWKEYIDANRVKEGMTIGEARLRSSRSIMLKLVGEGKLETGRPPREFLEVRSWEDAMRDSSNRKETITLRDRMLQDLMANRICQPQDCDTYLCQASWWMASCDAKSDQQATRIEEQRQNMIDGVLQAGEMPCSFEDWFKASEWSEHAERFPEERGEIRQMEEQMMENVLDEGVAPTAPRGCFAYQNGIDISRKRKLIKERNAPGCGKRVALAFMMIGSADAWHPREHAGLQAGTYCIQKSERRDDRYPGARSREEDRQIGKAKFDIAEWNKRKRNAQPAEKERLIQQLAKMQKAFVDNDLTYRPDEIPEDRVATAKEIGYDGSQPGLWCYKGEVGAGAYGTATLWVQLDAQARYVNRQVLKDTYLNNGRWDHAAYWAGDIDSRTPLEFEIVTQLKVLPGSDNIVEYHETRAYAEKKHVQDLIEAHREAQELQTAEGTAVNWRISPRLLWCIFEGLASALCLAHEGSLPENTHRPPKIVPVIHRDVKPANILLAASHADVWPELPIVKLADWGLVVPKSAGYHLTRRAGTAAWMAPEVLPYEGSDHSLYGDHEPSEASDIWSLGRVMLALANLDKTNVKPFRFGNAPPTYGRGVQDRLPPRMVALIDRCLETEPNDRIKCGVLWKNIQAQVATFKGPFGQPMKMKKREEDEVLLCRHDKYRAWGR
ncbi:hypothetical protein CBER1_09129 [Cercospora berteroae]|uniref:Protein kinase domain-containing protein n=1 Tax=Cercospora berteroae TaxID=357750 RepID=A0A2S6BWI1_9PEZI|nr:hypothetical protein CBER1_09129 [Cercospora berteroae]